MIRNRKVSYRKTQKMKRQMRHLIEMNYEKNTEIEDLNHEVTKALKVNDRLSQNHNIEVESLNRKISKLRQSLKEKHDEFLQDKENLQLENKDLKLQYTKMIAIVHQLQEEIQQSTHSDALITQNTEVDALKSTIHQQEIRIKELSNKFKSCHDTLESEDILISDLRKSLVKVTNENRNIENTLKYVENQLNSLQTNHRDSINFMIMTGKNDSSEQHTNGPETSIDRSSKSESSEIHQYKKRILSLEKQNDRLQKSLSEYETELHSLKISSNISNDTYTTKSTTTQTTNSVTDKKQQPIYTDGHWKRLRHRLSSLQYANAQNEAKKERLLIENRSLKQEVNALSQNASVNGDANSTYNDTETLSKLKSTIRRLTKEKTNLANTVMNLKTEYEIVNANLSNVQSQFELNKIKQFSQNNLVSDKTSDSYSMKSQQSDTMSTIEQKLKEHYRHTKNSFAELNKAIEETASIDLLSRVQSNRQSKPLKIKISEFEVGSSRENINSQNKKILNKDEISATDKNKGTININRQTKKSKWDLIKKRLNRLKRSSGDAKQEFNDFKQRCSYLENKLRVSQDNASKIEDNLTSVKQANESLVSELNVTRSKLREINLDRLNLQEQLSNVHTTFDRSNAGTASPSFSSSSEYEPIFVNVNE